MADFDPSKLSKKELQDLYRELEKIGTLTSNVVDDERSIRDVILDQTKQLKFQQTLKKDMLRATNKLYDIQYNIRNEYDRELGTRKATLALDKELYQLDKSVHSLNQDIAYLEKQKSEYSQDLAKSLTAQVKKAGEYKKVLEDQKNTSNEIRENVGVKGFQGLSELFEKMGGKASQLASPFEKAAEAARETSQENIEGNKKAIEGQNDLIERLKSGQTSATKKNLDGLEILNKKGQKLYGKAAQNSLKSGNATVKGAAKIMSKSKMGMASLSAGFKVLGPLVKKALGPIGIILTVKDIIQFFVKVMFAASEQTAKFEKNLKVSGDEANRIRKRTNFIANDTSKINRELGDSVKEFRELNRSSNTLLFTQKEIIKAMEEMNTSLGTSVDFTSELADYGADLLRGQVVLTKTMGLTAKEAEVITNIQLRQGKEQVEFTKAVLGTVEAQNTLNDTRISSTLVLKDIANLSAEVRATIGDTTSELARNVYEARKLGFQFSDLQNAQSNLLDFEGSITKELEAELILGRDINLEKARAAALNNDLVGVGKELRNQNIDIKKLQKENAIAAQSAAAAMGMTVDQAIKAQEAFENQNALQERINANKEVSIALSQEGITAEKLKNMTLEDIRSTAEKINVTEAELGKILGEKAFEAAKARSAQEKFNEVLEKAKEQFANLVGSGVLDALVEGLTGLVDSKIFRAFSGGTREDFQRRKDVRVAQQQGLATDSDVATADAHGQYNVMDMVDDVFKYTNVTSFAISKLKDAIDENKINKLDAKLEGIPRSSNTTLPVNDFTIRTHPKDTLVMAGGTKLNEDSKETNQLLRTLITAVENGGNVYLNNQLVGEISNQQQLNSFRAGS